MMDGNEGAEKWTDLLWRIGNDDPNVTSLDIDEIAAIDVNWIQNMTDENWEELGHIIANNTHMKKVDISFGWLKDHKMSYLFRGLTRSSSIDCMRLYQNTLSIAAVRSMVPFLQNANNLIQLELDCNNIQSEGFNFLFRALSDSPIEVLDCQYCDIESIEIDTENKPKNLKKLLLDGNSINADGCRGLANLLHGDATLTELHLVDNKIDDEGVEILTNALQNNTSLRELLLLMNNFISHQGQIMLLKLVDDVSSIEATLQSNHTLRKITFPSSYTDSKIYKQLNVATAINSCCLPGEAVKKKVIQTQLNSKRRAKFAALQGVNHSLYSEIDPLHLPEVLALVGRHHGQGELFMALKSSIAGVISTVNERQCLEQERSHYRAVIAEYTNKLEAVEAKIATIEASEGHGVDSRGEFRSNKRRRKRWWGLWGGS